MFSSASSFSKSPWGKMEVVIHFPGIHNVYNALSAISLALFYGLDINDIQEALFQVHHVPGRWELVEAGQDFTVIVDFAHNWHGLEKSLSIIRDLTPGKVITVFGCGGERDRSKRPFIGETVARFSDACIVTTDNPRERVRSKLLDALEGVKRAAKNKDLHFEVFWIEKMPSGRLWNWLKRRYSFWQGRAREIPGVWRKAIPHNDHYIAWKILKERKMKFYPQEIVEITQAEMQKTGKAPFFEGVAIDSRSLKAGQLFVALKGERTDGHLFVKEAIKKGAPGVLVSRFEDGEEETYVFRVPDTFLALQRLGRGASQKLSGYKIAITGTVGKTTCKSFFASLLSRRFLVEATPQSFNTVIGVASSIANFKENNDYLIIEAGISKKKEMEELAEIIDPHMVVFTSFGEGHLEGLGSVEEVVEEKIKLVREKTEIIYLNTDQKWSGLVGKR